MKPRKRNDFSRTAPRGLWVVRILGRRLRLTREGIRRRRPRTACTRPHPRPRRECEVHRSGGWSKAIRADRVPEKTPLYKVVAEHLEGWLETRAVAEQPVSAHVERELRSYLTCGILCFGFGRARCTSCGQGFVVALSCKGRGVCPSCNGRRMAQTAAHLVDHVIPPVPVRQWVISVPKRLRCFLADLVPPPRKHRHRPAGGWRGGRAKPRLWLRPP